MFLTKYFQFFHVIDQADINHSVYHFHFKRKTEKLITTLHFLKYFCSINMICKIDKSVLNVLNMK